MDSRCLTTRAIIASILRWTAIIGVTALVASCALHKSPASAHGKDVPGAGPGKIARQCGPGDVRIRLDVRAAGVAAGTSYIPLDFTNSSSASCLLSGFPAVALARSRAGKRLGTAAVDARNATAQAMELRAGQTAHIWLHLVDVANLPAARCRPVTAAGLLVTLPGQHRPVFVSHPLPACARRVPGTDILTIEPFHPGPAKPGTAQ